MSKVNDERHTSVTTTPTKHTICAANTTMYIGYYPADTDLCRTSRMIYVTCEVLSAMRYEPNEIQSNPAFRLIFLGNNKHQQVKVLTFAS